MRILVHDSIATKINKISREILVIFFCELSFCVRQSGRYFSWDNMRNIKPPLSFTGHKGHWASELTDIAKQLPYDCTVFDVFGGSGICSEYIKRARPDITVIWNDFDNYRARLDNVDKTERLRRYFIEKLGRPLPKKAYIPPLSLDQRQFVFDTLKQQISDYGFCDFQTISRWFYMYPLKTHKLMSFTGKLYNRVPVVPMRLDACNSWLSDVLRNSVTFTGIDTEFYLYDKLVKLRDYIPNQNALLILDPPYLGTGCNDYGNQESLKILKDVCDCCNHLPFLLFGDSSISFWYDQIVKDRHYLKYEKVINNTGMNHSKRSEVLFACLPC